MNSKLRLLGYCGLYCGACNHYRSSYPESNYLLEEGIKRGEDPNNFTCRGCRGEIEYLHPGCDVCSIKLCAEDEGLVHCGLCSAFPCKKIIGFQYDNRYMHHRAVVDNLKELKEKGPDLWLEEQGKKWTCTCGMPFSWYEKNCSKCDSSLPTYATNSRKKRC